MNTLTHLALLAPIKFGESSIINWLLTMVVIAGVFSFVVWLITKVLGPPAIPEQARWILWIIVVVALIVFLFGALGISLP